MGAQLNLWRGESRTLTFTVTDLSTSALADLSTGIWQVTACEFQIKSAIDGADPPAVAKSMVSGVIVLPQTGATLGQLQVTLAPTDTSGLATGRYYYDLVVTLASGDRVYLVKPTALALNGVVNQL